MEEYLTDNTLVKSALLQKIAISGGKVLATWAEPI